MDNFKEYYINGSDHYMIPANDLAYYIRQYEKKIQDLESQLNYIRSGEYYNQLRFERDMLQDVVDGYKNAKEDV